MSDFKLFEFHNATILSDFRRKKEIPVNFYNKDGQILIYKKENASENEIERLLRFLIQGIYYHVTDTEKLGITEKIEIPEGLTDTKLLNQKQAEELIKEAEELFLQLKSSSISSIQARTTSERLVGIFTDFEAQSDVMTGLVNILEIMKGQKDKGYDVEMAVKRTVVAMAIKTRGLQTSINKDKAVQHQTMINLMLSALVCDAGYTIMALPKHEGLTDKEMRHIHNHPFLSYLLLAPIKEIDPRVKNMVLNHHRPLRMGVRGNNFPKLKWIKRSLEVMFKLHKEIPEGGFAGDLEIQMKMLKKDTTYDEDLNILAIASEFASLTSRVPWREPFSATYSVRMIINNSLFTYSYRIVREFLDHVAISLCDNTKILEIGDFIILACQTVDGKVIFEICRIMDVGRYQSQPIVKRLGFIKPIIKTSPKNILDGIDMNSIQYDRRNANFDLKLDDSRRIVYAFDPLDDLEIIMKLQKISTNL